MKKKIKKREKLFDFRFLSRCALNDLGFLLIAVVGIFNFMILGFVYSLYPALKMTRQIAEAAAKGLTRDEAVFATLEKVDLTNIVFFGSIKAVAVLILGFLLILLVLTFFKGRIYLSLRDKKLDKTYFKQFFVFNICYYLVFLAVPLIIIFTFKSMAAAKIVIMIMLVYAYLTPIIRIHFRSSNNYFANYINIIKTSLKSAIQLGVLLRSLGIALSFIVLYFVSAIIGTLLGIIGGIIIFILFLYLSAVSRNIISHAIQDVK